MPNRRKVAIGLGLAGFFTGIVLAIRGRAPDNGEPPGAVEFILSELSIEPGEVNIHEQVFLSVTVTNIGLVPGSYQVIGLVGDSELTKTVSLNPGQSKQVSFTVIPDKPGVYDVTMDGLTGSFDVIEEEPPPDGEPPTGDPALISINLPSVPSGEEFYPQYTLFLPKPWGGVEPVYEIEFSVTPKIQGGTIITAVVLPSDLTHADNIYTQDDIFHFGGYPIAMRLEPGIYNIGGKITASQYLGGEHTTYSYGAPQKIYKLGTVGSLTVTEPILPAPVIQGQLTGLALWQRGDWNPSALVPIISLSEYYNTILIFLLNDTIIEGTTAEFDKTLAYGPFDIAVTMNGEPWPVEGTPKMWGPGWAWDKRGKAAWDVFTRFPPVGSYTMEVTLSAQGRLLDTKSVSFTIVS